MMAKKQVEPEQIIIEETAVMDEHEDQRTRNLLTVQTIKGSLSPAFTSAENGRYAFHNYGPMVTFLIARNAGNDPVIVYVRTATEGRRDSATKVEAGETAYIGPFPDVHFNRLDQTIWVDAPNLVELAVCRLGL